ncbi:MAG TPA: hypothetical protein VGF15_07390 [Solirubrobacteraceae bacterium]
MDPEGVKVLLEVPCTHCEGSGRVGWDSPTPGGYASDQTKPCPDCSERGYVETALALPEFKHLLGGSES